MERELGLSGEMWTFGCDVWRKAVGDRRAADYEAELRKFPDHVSTLDSYSGRETGNDNSIHIQLTSYVHTKSTYSFEVK